MLHDMGHTRSLLENLCLTKMSAICQGSTTEACNEKAFKTFFQAFFFKFCPVLCFSTLLDENLKKKRALHILLDRLLKLFKRKKKKTKKHCGKESPAKLGELSRRFKEIISKVHRQT